VSQEQDGQELMPEAPVEPQDGHGYDIPPPPNPEARKALTAFLVVVEPDGTSWATNDVNLDLVLERPPTLGDMYRGCAEVSKDIATSEAAQKTVGLMMQAQAQMAQQMQQEKIAAKLAQKGIRVPGR
jgi:hypothetical protein